MIFQTMYNILSLTVKLQLSAKVLGYDPYADNQYLIKLRTGSGVSLDIGVTEEWLENHIK